MYQLYFATGNKGKIASMKRDLAGLNVELVAVDLEIPEIRNDETVEIARLKAEHAFSHLNKPCLAQDGGFYIGSLNGFPKAYVNFVLGTIGLSGILKLVKGKDRHCEFRDTLAFMDEKLKKPKLFTTVTKGVLAEKPRGELQAHHWGELHKIFIPEGQTKTFAQMTALEMDDWRITAKKNWCGRQFARWFEKNRLKNI